MGPVLSGGILVSTLLASELLLPERPGSENQEHLAKTQTKDPHHIGTWTLWDYATIKPKTTLVFSGPAISEIAKSVP